MHQPAVTVVALSIILSLCAACAADPMLASAAGLDGGRTPDPAFAGDLLADPEAGSISQEVDAGARALPSTDAGAGAARDTGDRSELGLDAASVGVRDAMTVTTTGSCYGRCGAMELLAVSADCACDVDCLRRADCCADKHEFCAVSDRASLCTLTGRELDPALCGSDLGWSFAHGDRLEMLFGDSYDANCTDPFPHDDAQGTLPLLRPAEVPIDPPTAPLSCAGLLALDKRPSARGDTFAPSILYENGVALSSWLSETPLTGFSDGQRVFMIARRGNTIEAPIYIAVRDPSAAPEVQPTRTVYRVLSRDDSPHFKNPTAATVANFHPDDPRQNDYGPGTQTLLLFGRGNFATSRAREVYLSQQRLPLVRDDGSASWAPSYFAGLSNGKPLWTSDDNQAVPVLSNDFERTMQFEVTWVPALQTWLMLYGGDVADWLDTTPNDQPRHGALHMRMAKHPWGPWSRATPVFWREHAAAFMHCDAPMQAPSGRNGCDLDELPNDPAHSFSPGTWAPELLDFPGCVSAELTPRQPNFQPGGLAPCTGAQRGNLYAPNLLDTWTQDRAGEHGYARAATLFFTVSTWMPYQVILASLTLHLPG